jgi:hypothetical protein
MEVYIDVADLAAVVLDVGDEMREPCVGSSRVSVADDAWVCEAPLVLLGDQGGVHVLERLHCFTCCAGPGG